MLRVIKLVSGLTVLVIAGLIYGGFNKHIDELSQDWIYSYMEFQLPSAEKMITMTMVKHVTESKCNKWRTDYFKATMKQCPQCIVLSNDCRNSVDNKYLKAFKLEKIESPYTYKPYKYPEIVVFSGLPEGGFDQMCNIEKTSLKTAKCIR